MKNGLSARMLMAAALLAMPLSALACACGCGVFEVGTGSLLPENTGLSVFMQTSYLDQSDNWSGSSSAPAVDNEDKHIRSEFYAVGVREMFNRDWGLTVQLPYTQRHFATVDEDSNTLGVFNHGAVGDIRITGMYTGFSEDLSSGLSFGVKLANGDWKYPGFDRDTEIGSGSTDVLLGGYHQTHFGTSQWSGYAQALLDAPIDSQGGYRPGNELDVAFGAYPQGWRLGPGVHLTPVLQALASLRRPDSGPESEPENTGYSRLLAAPGMELQWRHVRLFVDVEAPLYQNVRGNQLVAPWQAKFTASFIL